MKEDWVAYAMGSALALLGLLMMAAHRRSWSRQDAQEWEGDFERQHYRRRYRRRTQTSFLIVLLGLMVALSPVAIPDPALAPKRFGIWWLSALVLAMWIGILAVADIASTRAHTHVALSRIRLRQQELERNLAEMKRHEGNGRHVQP